MISNGKGKGKKMTTNDIKTEARPIDIFVDDIAPVSPQPGPSAFYILYEEESDEETIPKSDLCCACGQFQHKAVKEAVSLVFVQWAQCDTCWHWTHLKYYSKKTFVRCHAMFACPHCE